MFNFDLNLSRFVQREAQRITARTAKSLGWDGYEADGMTAWDMFGAPGDSAQYGSAYRDIEQVRGWNHTAILAKSYQFTLASLTVFCSPEIADFVSAGRENYRAASRISGIEHFAVPEDWVQAPREYRIARLMRQPNDFEDESIFKFRISQQIETHGVCYILVLPNSEGIPSQLYVIPKYGVQPQPSSTKFPGGSYRTHNLSRNMRPIENSARPNSFAEMLGWLSNKEFDAKYVIPIGLPSIAFMDDFLNPSSAIADVLDTDKEIHRSRRRTLQNQFSQGPMLSEEPGVSLQSDERAQLMEELAANATGPNNAGSPWWKPAGVSIKNDAHSAREMEYADASVQSRDAVLGQRLVPPGLVGLGDVNSHTGVVGIIRTWTRMAGQPLMRIMAGQLTIGLSRFFPEEDRQFQIVMQAANIDDEQLKIAQRQLALSSGTRTVKEWREEDNLEPFGDERDNAIVGTLQAQQPANAQQPGMPQAPNAESPMLQQGVPGVGVGESDRPTVAPNAAEKAGGGFATLTRSQFKRNRTAVMETLRDVASGTLAAGTARVLLQTIGLSPEESESLLASVQESKPEPTVAPATAAQDAGDSFFTKMLSVRKTVQPTNEGPNVEDELGEDDESLKIAGCGEASLRNGDATAAVAAGPGTYGRGEAARVRVRPEQDATPEEEQSILDDVRRWFESTQAML